MKQTIALSAPRSSALPKLRTAAQSIFSKIFADRVVIAVVALAFPAAFFLAVIDESRAAAALFAAAMPWFIKGLNQKGGEL